MYVTHNMANAFAMADRIAIMRDGQLVQVGTAKELIENPADEFVRDYLRSSWERASAFFRSKMNLASSFSVSLVIPLQAAGQFLYFTATMR